MNRRRRQTVEKVWKAMETLCNTYECSEVYIFGSAASSDHFSEMSDVDIGIGGLDKLSHYRFIADLSERIERDVDVVRLEDCSFADAIRTRGIRWKKNN
jgi:hypothetical protein